MKNMKKLTKFFSLKMPIWIAIFLLLVGTGIFYAAPYLQNSKNSTSTSMVKYLEKVDEHVFLAVGIETVVTKSEDIKIPLTDLGIPLTEKKAIIILNYQAKLGIKKPVKLDSVSDTHIRVELPPYEVIGFELDDKNPYTLYDTSGELLSYSTKDIDTGELVTETLSTEKQKSYINQYRDQINESAKDYYESLFKSVDKDYEVEVIPSEE